MINKQDVTLLFKDLLANGDLLQGSSVFDSCYYHNELGFISANITNKYENFTYLDLEKLTNLTSQDLYENGIIIVPSARLYISDIEIKEFSDLKFNYMQFQLLKLFKLLNTDY